ncbi:MAG: DUF362 domain-containing protein [Elusimicrobiota bacterium]
MKTSRRRFLQVLLSGAAVGLFPKLPGRLLWAKTSPKPPREFPDLVAVKDGSPAQMFEAGIKALGGMGRFVKKGQTVLVKPNIGWNKTPNEAANTNPDLIGRIVALAYEAGAKKVYAFDHPVNLEEECYERSGIAKAVKDNGGEMRSAKKEAYYRKVTLEKTKVLKEVLVHELYLDCDVVINVPVLKSHGGGLMTSALKNLMGVVWDRRYWHRKGLHQAIGEFPLVRRPDLNVIDAYIVMMKNGPRGVSTEDLLLKKMQLLSTDMVLVDTAAAKILGLDPGEIPYLKTAAGLGIGTMDLEKSSIKRISLKSPSAP